MAGEIVERHAGARDLVIIAVRRGGFAMAGELVRWLRELEQYEPPLGSVDVTFYRDDASTAQPNARIGPSEVPCSLDDRHVLLVDDVLHTGRTVRAAIDALMDYGRPRLIELAVLVDRRGRQLPIQADYFLKVEPVADGKLHHHRARVPLHRAGPAECSEEAPKFIHMTYTPPGKTFCLNH